MPAWASHIATRMIPTRKISGHGRTQTCCKARINPSSWICALLVAVCLLLASGHAHGGEITFDQYSLLLNGKRLVILSGEFHYWRLPAPDLWPDILKKIRAAGYNAVRIVFPWSYHSPSPGIYDFQGIRDVALVLEECKRHDLYVLAATGPYICGETDAGGFPGWLLTHSYKLRCLEGLILPKGSYEPEYVQKWSRQWLSRILPIVASYQITQDPPGPVILVQIENEYPETLFRVGTVKILPGIGDRQYMEELVSMAREYGINVPLFHNDFPPAGSWDDLVDISSFDLYPYIGGAPGPGSPPWSTRNTLRPLLDQTEALVRSYGGPATRTPLFVAEFQGGWYDGWGSGGYDAAYDFFGPSYFTILDKSLLGQGFSMINRYMFYGGTNWGYLSNPEVYTSYDYSAPIREWGVLSTTYAAMKKVGMFVEAFPDLIAASDHIEVPREYCEEPRAFYRCRQSLHENKDGSHPWLTFLRNGDTAEEYRTHIQVEWQAGIHTIPQAPDLFIPLPKRSMRIVVSNYDLGGLTLLYSTFELLTRVPHRDSTILAVYGGRGEEGEIAFSLPDVPEVTFSSDTLSFQYDSETRELLIRTSIAEDPSFLKFTWPGATGAWIIVFLDEDLAGRTWRVEHDRQETLVIGPYLVPAKALEQASRNTVSIPFWIHMPTQVYLFPGQKGSATISNLSTDAIAVPELDLYTFTVRPEEPPGLPELGPWRFTFDAPEIEPEYDDSSWQAIPEGGSLNPDLYGFHYGFVWYRGTHTLSRYARPLALVLDGRHCYSVYWNGLFIGSHDTYSASFMAPGAAGSPDLLPDPAVFRIPAGSIQDTNTVAVLVESLGHNKDFALYPDIYNPRGLISVSIVGDPKARIEWKIHGRGEDKGFDHFNSSGLHGELAGYYQPGFDDSDWEPVDLPHDWESSQSVPQGFAGPGWYRTTFWLDLPEKSESPVCLHIRKGSSKATLWLNGWLVGRYWEKMGPQHRFYLPEGILNPNGENTLAICLWRKGDEQGNPDPAVIDIAGLEAYPFDHRVNGGPPAHAQSEPPPFGATRYDLSVSVEGSHDSDQGIQESNHACGCAHLGSTMRLSSVQNLITGLVYCLPLGYILIRRRSHTSSLMVPEAHQLLLDHGQCLPYTSFGSAP